MNSTTPSATFAHVFTRANSSIWCASCSKYQIDHCPLLETWMLLLEPWVQCFGAIERRRVSSFRNSAALLCRLMLLFLWHSFDTHSPLPGTFFAEETLLKRRNYRCLKLYLSEFKRDFFIQKPKRGTNVAHRRMRVPCPLNSLWCAVFARSCDSNGVRLWK
jgi:hypothetical protein